MQLILARHGNTFNPGEPVVWIGSRNNLPLVKAGEAQAAKLGNCLQQAPVKITAIYAGPLLRMISYAKIVAASAHSLLPLHIDERLNEIDYGGWSGLTQRAVCEQFGNDAFIEWDRDSQWPQNSGWGESENAVKTRILDFVQSLLQTHDPHERILVVASNGCLRYFLHLIPLQFAASVKNATLKLATGHIAQLTYAKPQWQLDYWNQSPEILLSGRAA